MNVLLLSRYGRMGASSRVRSYQYLGYLRDHGVRVTPAPLLDDHYLAALYRGERRSVLALVESYSKRLRRLSQASDFDLVWIEYEALPWLPAWAERWLYRRRVPYVVDYDDAIFHRYELHPRAPIRWALGRKIDNVMKRATLVIAGSRYLALRAERAGAPRVALIPTVVDLARYDEAPVAAGRLERIGWIGSPGTAKYLQLVRPALEIACAPACTRLVVIGAGAKELQGLAAVVRPWSEETEVSEIRSLDVGIMPLPDEPWERGKCGYKLIQYMACGRPVVASPVGANSDIVEHGVSGFLAVTTSEWLDAFDALQDCTLRTKLGAAGRDRVEKEFSLQVTAPMLLALIRDAA